MANFKQRLYEAMYKAGINNAETLINDATQEVERGKASAMRWFDVARAKPVPFLVCAALGLVLGLMLCASNAMAGELAGWKATPQETGAMEYMMQTDAGGSIIGCTAKGCVIALEPVRGCKPGSRYPLLLNAPSRHGVMPGICMETKDGAGNLRNIVFVPGSTGPAMTVMSGEKMSVALPLDDGTFDIFRFDPKGLSETMGIKKPTGIKLPAHFKYAA